MAWTGVARLVGLVAVLIAIAIVVPQLLGRDAEEDRGTAGASPRAQHVVAWTLHEEGGPTYLAVLARGARPPVVLAVPADVTINLPGQNLGTLSEAAAAGDVGLLEVAVENLIGVQVDVIELAPLASIGELADAVGGLEVRGSRMLGEEVDAYLTELPEDAPLDLAFLRWQDVLDGVIASAADHRAALPETLRRPLGGPRPFLATLPVIDIGGGLLRPDQSTLPALVARHFVPTAADAIRLVVLNGVGTPGIGEEVARILVPEGFQLMSSGNANTFELDVTKIIASSREDLSAAERARELLGAGEVQLGNQPSGLADVTVVVGQDFGGS